MNTVQGMNTDVRQLVGDVTRGVGNVEQGAVNVVEAVLHWRPFELLFHLVFVALAVYLVYVMAVSSHERSTSNLLLLLIALGVVVQIHQNINIKNSMMGL